MKTFHLHLVSDATGETVTSVTRACLVQFEAIHPITHNWWLVRTQGQVERVIAGIEDNPGLVQFTLAHDDGQLIELVEEADIVLVGVSRSSKTPTSMYLANRGLKCANYPLVPGVPLPSELEKAKKPLVVGLTKDPKSLSDIRRARLRLLNQEEEADYAQFDKVKEEVQEARRLFTRLGWPVVDVTRRSIEEASATIMQLYAKHLEKHGLVDGGAS